MIYLELERQEKTSFRVHDLLLDFARKKLKATGTLTDVQRLFVETLRSQCVNGQWETSSTSNQKDYYFKYLPYHIYSSEQQSKLLQLFFDLHWLQQKVKHTNLPSVVSDFRFLSTPPEEMELLKSSLMSSAYVIEKNPDSICPQLLGNRNNKLYFFVLVRFNFALLGFGGFCCASSAMSCFAHCCPAPPSRALPPCPFSLAIVALHFLGLLCLSSALLHYLVSAGSTVGLQKKVKREKLWQYAEQAA